MKKILRVTVEQSAGTGDIEKYPELEKIAEDIAVQTAKLINERVRGITSKMPYKAQWVLEQVVVKLEDRI